MWCQVWRCLEVGACFAGGTLSGDPALQCPWRQDAMPILLDSYSYTAVYPTSDLPCSAGGLPPTSGRRVHLENLHNTGSATNFTVRRSSGVLVWIWLVRHRKIIIRKCLTTARFQCSGCFFKVLPRSFGPHLPFCGVQLFCSPERESLWASGQPLWPYRAEPHAARCDKNTQRNVATLHWGKTPQALPENQGFCPTLPSLFAQGHALANIGKIVASFPCLHVSLQLLREFHERTPMATSTEAFCTSPPQERFSQMPSTKM